MNVNLPNNIVTYFTLGENLTLLGSDIHDQSEISYTMFCNVRSGYPAM